MTWDFIFWASLSAAGLLAGLFLLRLIIRYRARLKNVALTASLTSCAWMAAILFTQYTGDVARFVPASAGCYYATQPTPVVEASREYSPEEKQAAQVVGLFGGPQ